MIKSNICVATAWHNNWRLIWLVLMAANWDNGRIRLPCLRGRYVVCTSLDDLTFLFLFQSTYSITIHITLLKASPPTYSVIHYYLVLLLICQIRKYDRLSRYILNKHLRFFMSGLMKLQNFVGNLIIKIKNNRYIYI